MTIQEREPLGYEVQKWKMKVTELIAAYLGRNIDIIALKMLFWNVQRFSLSMITKNFFKKITSLFTANSVFCLNISLYFNLCERLISLSGVQCRLFRT